MKLYPVILAGGSGTRLWPLSRDHYPKQFLSLMGERSMLQETVCRLDGMENVAPPIIVCNEVHQFLLAGQLREIDRKGLASIIEPSGRNTAPALTLAALKLAEIVKDKEEDPIILVMSADHVITDQRVFHNVVREGAAHAAAGRLVTFGVVPDAAVTGYGYIQKGAAAGAPATKAATAAGASSLTARELAAFVEKPNLATAEKYVASGDYLWNSGIFMMRASVWLAELKKYRPDISDACVAAYSAGKTDGDFFRPGREQFTECPSDSIDYAVMEKAAAAIYSRNGNGASGESHGATGCVVVPMDAGWSDIGAWSALWEERGHDENGNVVQGDVYAHSTKNSLLLSQHRLLATVGLEDVVIVETGDAVLVAKKDRAQEVKEIVQRLKKDRRPEYVVHRKVHRPWGTYEVLDKGPGFQVKRLTINVGAAISLQMHYHRSEHWIVVTGTAKVTRGDEVFLLTEDQSAYASKGMKHRLENPGKVPLELIEVGSGAYLGEDDIVRFEDNYNRK
ncbi:MAG: cupin domain-containing protein [SAR202 cluster bacterium]|nr:cupin domain-containing protein [SAR202 cluster bacterium]